MIQRMRNTIPIDVKDIDLATVEELEVYLEQKSTNTLLKFSGEDIEVLDEDTLSVSISKEDGMRFSTATVRGQVAYTTNDGTPGATKVFYVPVYELLWRDGYGD